MKRNYHFPRMRLAAFVSAAVLCASSGGCASIVPPFDIPYETTATGENEPTVSSIVRRVQCELIEIAGDKGTELNRLLIAEQDIQALVELSLSVTQDGKLAPTFSFIGAPFNFGTGFSHERSREQNFTTYLTFSLEALSRTPWDPVCNAPADTNLAGTLGLKQMFRLAKTSGSFQQWSQKGSFGAFGGSITFTVDSQLSPTGPTYKFTTFEGPGPLLTASNKNVDKLTFGFIRGPKAELARARLQAYDVIASVKQNQIANSLQLLANVR